VFQNNRSEISKVNAGNFSIENSVKEFGRDQLVDNLLHMLDREAGRSGMRNLSVNLQHSPADYLQQNF